MTHPVSPGRIFTMLSGYHQVMRPTLVTALLLAGLFSVTPAALSQESNPDPSVVRNNLETTSDELALSTARQNELAEEVANAIKAEQEISAKLVEAGRSIASLEQALAETDTKLKQLGDQKQSITRDLAQKQDMLSELLGALQVLEQNPPPALVVAPNDILEALRGAMMFGAVVPDMRDQALLLVHQLERLESIKRETEISRADAKTQIASLALSYRELETLQREKQELNQTASATLEEERKTTARLAKQARNLQDLLTSLETEAAKRQAELTQEALRKEKERERQLAALAKPGLRLSKAKGRLDYPTQGRIVSRFGDNNGLGSTMSGLAIATEKAVQVRAPIGGTVEFAGPFRTYGQLLIIAAGEDYLVVLAGMDQILVTRGQSVTIGEPVGKMGEGPSSVAIVGKAAASLTPVLYVEFRKNGKPIDSAEWWIGGRKEARQ